MDFTNLLNTISKLQAFKAEDEVPAIVTENAGDLVKLQKEQLSEGRGIDGEFIRPLYSENPYFKTPEAAMRYAKYKQKITPNPLRPLDVPNLFINGRYVYDNIFVRLTKNVFSLEADGIGQQILDEHPNAAGLDAEKRAIFAEKIVLPQFKKVFKEKTNFNM